ncbi:MAG: hypothetical protein IPJ03_02115 [Ignavibacteriales bacterium]|nr:hypothetical protein [Ignavibacteriales bacterium]
MKTFQVTYRISDVSFETICVKADTIVPRTQGVELCKIDHTIVAFFPFENLVAITDSECLDKSKP